MEATTLVAVSETDPSPKEGKPYLHPERIGDEMNYGKQITIRRIA